MKLSLSNPFKERAASTIFLVSALASILFVALICVFLFANGVPAILKIGVPDFLFGKEWAPTDEPAVYGIFPMILYGIFPMILGSLYVTLGALAIGVSVGLLSAIFLARFCSERLHRTLKPAVELLAGIPSVIYGFFGLVVIVPFVRQHFGGSGFSIFTASILLGIMILPTIISVSEAALRAVPNSYYEGSLALGATHERSVFFTVLPAATSGIVAGIILGFGRAIGETMAVILVASNQARMPDGILGGIRTLTANIVLEMGYATDLHRESLIATGVVLFSFILTINLLFSILKKRVVK